MSIDCKIKYKLPGALTSVSVKLLLTTWEFTEHFSVKFIPTRSELSKLMGKKELSICPFDRCEIVHMVKSVDKEWVDSWWVVGKLKVNTLRK